MTDTPSWLKEEPNSSAGTANDPSWTKEEQPKPVAPFSIETGAPPVPTNNTNNNETSNSEAARNKTWSDFWSDSFRRDVRLLLIVLVVIVCMNIPVARFALYPFLVFTTWVHEMCHGMAALIVGGEIAKLEVFADTSGLAHTAVDPSRRAFVSSAGYQGCAVVGCLLLLLRRTKRGPRTGTMIIGITMLLSVALWIRNLFGIVFILLSGVGLMAAAWLLPSHHIRNLYVTIASITCLDAITSVRSLFGDGQQVNGNDVSTDAHTMAELKGGSNGMWAMIWLGLALFMTAVGFLFAVPGPDEVADFTLCGVCQDMGCFKICNLPGLRWFAGHRPNTAANISNNASGGNNTPVTSNTIASDDRI